MAIRSATDQAASPPAHCKSERADLDLALQEHDQEDEHEDELGVDRETTVLELDPAAYPGGIAIWGALPTVFDTSICPPDQGVHVHARMKVGRKKSLDETFDVVEVKVTGQMGRYETFRIDGDDASQYNISTILRKKLKYLKCPDCGHRHSDKLWFAVNYHREHTCEVCGACFTDAEPSISNPIMLMKEVCGDVLQDREIIDPVQRKIPVRQADYPGGIQIWGSNPAILWTSPKLEEGGIHFHGFRERTVTPTADETFGVVRMDGRSLNPEMVRHLMAQQALPYLVNHLCSLTCPHCQQSHFDRFEAAIAPHGCHMCEHCHSEFQSPEESPLAVSNPLIDTVMQCYLKFHELFPDVALTPRFPWDPC
jgi:hypothetical protein